MSEFKIDAVGPYRERYGVRLEQRWTCGGKSEWRPIPVEVPE